MYRILVIGSVSSTDRILRALVRHQLNVVGVLGLAQDRSTTVANYVDLSGVSRKFSIPFKCFRQINDEQNIGWIRAQNPDVVFAVGLSQLLSKKVLEIPAKCCIGFHPTNLPKGRGRAPLAWLVLNESSGAATFFQMSENADDGPIFAQSEFPILENDYVSDVEQRMLEHIDICLDEWLPKLRIGQWEQTKQAEEEATYYGKRTPEDGWINWTRPVQEIYSLIRASSQPHPGAYTYLRNSKMIIYRARPFENVNIEGVVGSIVELSGARPVIQCGEGHLLVEEVEYLDYGGAIATVVAKVGDRCGYRLEDYIFRLINE